VPQGPGLGVELNEMPATPERVRAAVRAAAGRSPAGENDRSTQEAPVR